MFIGHYALGFAAKRAAPSASLGLLFLAAQFADLLWPSLVLAGIEVVRIAPGATALTPLVFVSYPFSHSLVMLVVWGCVVGLAYRVLRHRAWRPVGIVAALVVSHWVLDWITHAPDMPIAPTDAGPKVGLGLWNHPWVEVPLEVGMFAWGVWLYARTTTAADRIGLRALWALVAFLLVVHAANLLGPPPPSVAAVAWSAQLLWLLVAWGVWIDRHRRVASA
ncbi:MAG: hypothetical protein AB7O28_04285 [Vicinamibacterales bacterium]